MAIAKKGSRKITVGDISYRWSIRKKPTYFQAAFEDNITAAVELLDQPASVLHITFPWARPDNWINPSKLAITPKLIEECITEAIENGWKPHICGSAMEMKYTDK